MQRILIIRRDNIGDLVCTTPFIHALRRQLPTARIDALVTDYNAAVLAGNPDLDTVHSYQKAKHRGDESALAVYLRRLHTVLRLRRARYDLAVLPGGEQASAIRFARLCGARRIVVRDDADRIADRDGMPLHEVEHCCALLPQLGLRYEAPPLVLTAPAVPAGSDGLPAGRPLVGLHISARKPSQRWPTERFAEFARACHRATGAAFLLFWSPGAADNPLHPGDDEKARQLLALCRDLPLHPMPSRTLPELIAGLARCDRVVCSDGGAMHLAAGLGKPLVCFFGQSDADRWRPWGVAHALLQPPSRAVADLGVDQVLAAFLSLEDGPGAMPGEAARRAGE